VRAKRSPLLSNMAQSNSAPLVLILCALTASWPQWMWLARRAGDGSDDPWGVLALFTLVVLFSLEKDRLSLPRSAGLAASIVLIVAGSLCLGLLPPIMAAALALSGLTLLIWAMLPKKCPLTPLLILAMLALPLVASLNFYLGYPLRWLCAQASALGLSLMGLSVTPMGAALLWNGKTVLIDTPCAGIAMLWVGMYLAALFSYLNAASLLRSCANLTAAVIIVVAGNILRNVLLFYKEAGLVALPHWTHEAIGLLVFGMIVPLIYFATHWRSHASN